MDLGNKGTLKRSHQLLEGLLPTQGVFPTSNWLNRICSPCSLPQKTAGSIPLGFTTKSFGIPILDIMLQFLILIPGGSGFTAPFSLDHPSDIQPQYYLQATANTIITNQIFYFCWLTAIIQKLWETAWDLLAHQNVELLEPGFGLPM